MMDLSKCVKELLVSLKVLITPDNTLLDLLSVMQQNNLSLIPVLNEHQQVTGGVFKDNLLYKIMETQSLQDSIADTIVDVSSYCLNCKDLTIETLETSKTDLIIVGEDGRFSGILTKDSIIDLCFKYYVMKTKEQDAIFNAAINGILIIDKDRIISKLNPAAQKITGLIPEKTIGRLPEQRGLIPIHCEQDSQLRVSHNGHVYVFKYSPVVIDDEVTEHIYIFQDITEFEDTLINLTQVKELNEELETIIHSSWDGILVTDPSGTVIKCNKSSMELLELDFSQLDDDSPQLPTCLSKVIKDTKLDTTTFTTHNGKGNELVVTIIPIFDKGNVVRFVLNIRDMTELIGLKDELHNSKLLSRKYKNELERLKTEKTENYSDTIARSKKMANVVDLAEKMAQVDTTVLILGETGVGKQLIAKTIHDKGPRNNGPLIDVNCGAITETLLESELFGYEPGSFTGGLKMGKIGLFECANEGTIFLDEIGDLPLSLQGKLLKVLQNQEVLRVGGRKPRKINIRVVAATNKNLAGMVKEGIFREDLFYRLNIVPITIPPLRERREDILPLIYYFKTCIEKKYFKNVDFTTDVYEVLLKYDWPGNVRELQNIVERLVVTADSSVVDPRQLISMFSDNQTTDLLTSVVTNINSIIPLKDAIQIVENRLIRNAIIKFGSTYKAAKALGIDQSTVARKAKKLKEQLI